MGRGSPQFVEAGVTVPSPLLVTAGLCAFGVGMAATAMAFPVLWHLVAAPLVDAGALSMRCAASPPGSVSAARRRPVRSGARRPRRERTVGSC